MRTPELHSLPTRPSPGLRRPLAVGSVSVFAALLLLAARPAQAGEAVAPAQAAVSADTAREAEVARQLRLQEAKVLAERGRKLVASGANAEARDALREALRLNPDDAAAKKLLARAETALGIQSSGDLLARTRDRQGFKAQVLRQQIQLDLFEAEKAVKEQNFARAAQQAERALVAAGQVDDAQSAAELRERAEKILAVAKAGKTSASTPDRQAEFDQAKAGAAAEKAQRTRDSAEGLKVLAAQGAKFLEAKEYEKAQAIADEMLRAEPDSAEARRLGDQIAQARGAAGSLRGRSRERRESEADLMKGIEKEMMPLKPNVVLAADRKRGAPSRALSGPMERWEYEVRSKLAAPVTVEFRETPLAQAVDQLAGVSGVNIILDPAMAGAQAPVTIPKSRMPAESMLRWVARFGKLSYCLRDGAVYLTGHKGTLDAPVTRTYDIASLLAPPTSAEPVSEPGPIEPGPRPEQVTEPANPDPEPIGRGWAQFIRSSISPETWDQGGTLQQKVNYNIQYRNGRIVVVHTPEVQQQIEALLNDFRKARSLQVHMQGRFITVEKKFLDSLNVSFSYANPATNPTPGEEDYYTSSMGPATGVPTLTEFDNYSASGGLALRCSILNDNSLVVLLKAVLHEGKGTVLEAPRLTCYNTQRANIQVLRNRNYIRRVGSDFVPEIGNIPEGTIFDIQPFVSSDRRYITLVCQPQMRTFVGFTTFTYGSQVVQLGTNAGGVSLVAIVDMTVQLPTTVLRSVGTTVTVPNGGTIIMGGFTNVQQWSGIASSPFLEGIPLLSYLLRGRDNLEGRRTLVMLITAETVEDIFEED